MGSERLTNLDSPTPARSLHTSEEHNLLSKFGGYESYESPAGDLITVFSTCSIPLAYLNRENWASVGDMGNSRAVYSVDSLIDGTKPHIVVKTPERIFTKEEMFLKTGSPWWGGPRTRERKVRIENNPIVEAQTFWEAVILLELNRHGIRAEVPQALLRNAQGSTKLVVNEIDVLHDHTETVGIRPTFNIIHDIGLVPADDWKGQNLLKDSLGQIWIIDVNRWTWPPHTDDFRKKLLQVVREA